MISLISKTLSQLQACPLILRLIILIVAGALSAFAQAPTYYLPLLLFGFTVCYFFYDACNNKKQCFISAFAFSLGYFVSGLYWIGNALLVEGNEDFLWAWPLAVIALPILLSSFHALYLTINHIFFPKKNIARFLGFCFFIAVAEFTRGTVFTGFPWNLYGYIWLEFMPIAQITSIIGPYGLTLLTILWASALGYILAPHHQIILKSVILFLSIATISLAAFFGTARIENTKISYQENIDIKIIQPNIKQADKWASDKLVENFNTHISLSEEDANPTKRTIIIWPETALPPAFIDNIAVNERISTMIENNNAVLLTGALNIENDKSTNQPLYHNALNFWSKFDKGNRLYSKSHLVPFGEYIPFQDYIPLQAVASFGAFEKGEGPQTIVIPELPSFSPLICYESIFPHEAINKMTSPEWILVITNDGWYGESAGPYQHLAQAQFRAIETGIPVIRSANTGISAIIDPLGQIEKYAPLMKKEAIIGNLPNPAPSETYYSIYREIPFFLMLITLGFSAILLRNKDF